MCIRDRNSTVALAFGVYHAIINGTGQVGNINRNVFININVFNRPYFLPHAIVYRPVSYTHLDVYKRQEVVDAVPKFVQGPVGVGALCHWKERPTERLTPVKPKIKLSSYKQKSGGLGKVAKATPAVGASLQVSNLLLK